MEDDNIQINITYDAPKTIDERKKSQEIIDQYEESDEESLSEEEIPTNNESNKTSSRPLLLSEQKKKTFDSYITKEPEEKQKKQEKLYEEIETDWAVTKQDNVFSNTTVDDLKESLPNKMIEHLKSMGMQIIITYNSRVGYYKIDYNSRSFI